MLVVVFGAGASFDSDPAVPAGTKQEHRPPLANALFDMDRQATRDAAAAFPRAAPALMAARADVKAGGTVEATLARLQAEAEAGGDPRARSQLMALRFYLQRVLTRIPDAWNAQAVQQTSYVSMLDQLARWQHVTGQRLCLITFNYDVLLERACRIVFGHRYDRMDAYQAPPGVHVYKPHGSVDWAQAAVWEGPLHPDDDAARNAICGRPDLQPRRDDLTVRAADAPVIDMSDRARQGMDVAWLPALAIPVEAKPDVVMPRGHLEALRADLGEAAAMICVGWRAREDHFLRILQESLPSAPIPVWAVSGGRHDAEETIDNLWPTGRFDRHCPIGGGFARFADPEPPPGPDRTAGEPLLGHVLRGTARTSPRRPGPGLDQQPPGPRIGYSYPPYAAPG